MTICGTKKPENSSKPTCAGAAKQASQEVSDLLVGVTLRAWRTGRALLRLLSQRDELRTRAYGSVWSWRRSRFTSEAAPDAAPLVGPAALRIGSIMSRKKAIASAAWGDMSGEGMLGPAGDAGGGGGGGRESTRLWLAHACLVVPAPQRAPGASGFCLRDLRFAFPGTKPLSFLRPGRTVAMPMPGVITGVAAMKRKVRSNCTRNDGSTANDEATCARRKLHCHKQMSRRPLWGPEARSFHWLVPAARTAMFVGLVTQFSRPLKFVGQFMRYSAAQQDKRKRMSGPQDAGGARRARRGAAGRAGAGRARTAEDQLEVWVDSE